MLAVIGVGAIGGACAAELAAAGQPVMGCVRRPFESLVLEAGERVLRVTLPLATDPATPPSPDLDWCLLATKAHQTPDAMRWFEAWDDGTTRLAVLQNGVEHLERVSRWVDATRVVPVVVGCPATAVEPGRVVQRGPARLWMPDDANGRAFAALFEGTAIEAIPTGDWTSAAWRKLCLNVVGGAIAALAGRPLPEVQHPQKRELALALALECAAVARAEGADLDDAFATRTALAQVESTTGGTPSTLTDRLAGRPIEADARNGTIGRIGARHGLTAPVNARAAELMAQAHAEPSRDWLPELANALA
jgi:2-dehydropantoate 2-reductase